MDETASCLQQCQNRQQLVPVSGQKPRTQNFKGSCGKQLSDEQMNALEALTSLKFKHIYVYVLIVMCASVYGGWRLFTLFFRDRASR